MIRARLRRRPIDGTTKMRSLYDDERAKTIYPQVCHYCGGPRNPCMDRMIPKMRDGPDAAGNLVWPAAHATP